MFELWKTLDIFFTQADWTPKAADYVKRECINLEAVNAHAGCLFILNCAYNGCGHFAFGDSGEPSAVIECLAEDAETIIDLCAWPLDRPERFATALGAGAVLGETQVTNPASWAFDKTLQVHRTPLRWLKADCVGICILDHHGTLPILARKLGPICGEDKEHAQDLMAIFSTPPVSPKDILYPVNIARRAA